MIGIYLGLFDDMIDIRDVIFDGLDILAEIMELLEHVI